MRYRAGVPVVFFEPEQRNDTRFTFPTAEMASCRKRGQSEYPFEFNRGLRWLALAGGVDLGAARQLVD
jgi:hypothetical protein